MGIIKLIKNYRELGHEEFMRKWKSGIATASPVQQINGQLIFTRITLIGIFLGLAASIYNWRTAWWIAIILFGAIGNTYLQYKALKNQRSNIEKMFNMINEKEVVKGGAEDV
jgi:hypothetical protein